MTPEKAREALESLCRQGFMEKLADGTYKPTALGRMVEMTLRNKN